MCDTQFMKQRLLPLLDVHSSEGILTEASCYGILLESPLCTSVFDRLSMTPSVLSSIQTRVRELYERVTACIIGLTVHFHCIYHTPAFLATHQYNGHPTLHQKYNVSVNQLVSISMMAQAFSAITKTDDHSLKPYLSLLYDIISNDFYQPQCRDHLEILSREDRMFQRIFTAVDRCRDIIIQIPH